MHSNTDTLLAQHPDIESVEALITDCNGAARGKWLPIEKLPALLTDGIKLPKSAVAQDAWGRDVPLVSGGAGLAGPGVDGHRCRSRAGRTDHV